MWPTLTWTRLPVLSMAIMRPGRGSGGTVWPFTGTGPPTATKVPLTVPRPGVRWVAHPGRAAIMASAKATEPITHLTQDETPGTLAWFRRPAGPVVLPAPRQQLGWRSSRSVQAGPTPVTGPPRTALHAAELQPAMPGLVLNGDTCRMSRSSRRREQLGRLQRNLPSECGGALIWLGRPPTSLAGYPAP